MNSLARRTPTTPLGGSRLYSPVASLLTVELNGTEFGDAIAEIEITANLRSERRNPKKTLERLFDQFHEYIKSLPSITFRRKRKRVEIAFCSEHFTEADERGNTSPDAEQLNVAAKEVAEALSLLKKRIKRDDDFHIESFLTRATQVLEAGLPSKTSWNNVDKEAKEIRKAILATKSPWELLDIDWDEFHSRARDILDAPFFWECTDDFAPNGNDTGADLLEDFKRWNKRNPKTSPMSFLERLMKGWGIEPIDWLVTAPSETRTLKERDSISVSVCNEAAIALAFATIKCRGQCPSDIAEYGLAALKRTSVLIKDSSMPDELKAEWSRKSKQMREKLEPYRG